MMPVVVAKQYQKDLQVDGSLKSRAWDFMMKLSSDPDGGGLDLKLPQGATDRRVRTARVDQNFRAVLFILPPDTYVLAAIKPHDEAYNYATSVRLNVNAANGAMELIAEKSIQRTVQEFRAKPQPLELSQVLPFEVAELVAIGIRPDVAEQAVRVTGEDQLIALVEDLPEWQQQALLDLATGKSLDEVCAVYEVGDVPSDDPEQSLQRSVTRMEFVTIEDNEELRRMVEGDFELWRTFLHPQQRTLADRPTYNGPFRLAGGAGTGKTVVALHRAVFLAKHPHRRVLLCTFNRTLAASLESQMRRLASTDVAARIVVLGVDQLVSRVALDVGIGVIRPLESKAQEQLWAAAVTAVDPPAELREMLTVEFLSAELRSVMLGMPALTKDNYLAAKRPGRHVRLNRLQRGIVWRVQEEFQRALVSERATTFELLAAQTAEVAQPRYDSIVVDEGQDLHAAHWRFLRALVTPGPNDMFICEDAHQRIYGERIVLSRFGIETRGRSRRLTLNYRSSRQNLRFALGVIGDAAIVDSDGELDTVSGYRAAFDGPAPTMRGFASSLAEEHNLAVVVQAWIDGGVTPGAVGILVRRQADRERARRALHAVGIPVEVLSSTTPSGRAAVVVATMHRAKGMEFSRVVVFGADAQTVPLRYLMDCATASDQQAVQDKERALLYVACSRARDELVVTWAGEPSPYLNAALAVETGAGIRHGVD